MLLIIINTAAAEIRQEINIYLRREAVRLAPGVWESPLPASRAGRIAADLERRLSPDCQARIIPVCKQCRRGQWLWGKQELELPPAFVMDRRGHNVPLSSAIPRRPETTLQRPAAPKNSRRDGGASTRAARQLTRRPRGHHGGSFG